MKVAHLLCVFQALFGHANAFIKPGNTRAIGFAEKVICMPSNLNRGLERGHLQRFTTKGLPMSDSSAAVAYKRTLEVPDRYKTDDWFRCLKSMPKSLIYRRITPHLIFNVVITAVFFGIYEFGGALPKVSGAAFSLITSALALLLVFRTNSAYDRFWEARKIWGAILNNSRSMSRFCNSRFFTNKSGENFKDPSKSWNGLSNPDRWEQVSDSPRKDLARYTAAFAPLLMLHLRGNKDNNGYQMVKHLLTRQEFQEIQKVACPPFLITRYLTQLVERVYSDISPEGTGANQSNELVALALAERQRLQFMIDEMINYLGMCERIARCPVPYSYSRHLSRFLTIWSALVPIIFITAFQPTGVGELIKNAWIASKAKAIAIAGAGASATAFTVDPSVAGASDSLPERLGRFFKAAFSSEGGAAVQSKWSEFWGKFWLHIGTSGLVSWALLGIQEIGHYIEEPFGMKREELGMIGLCGTVERECLASLEYSTYSYVKT